METVKSVIENLPIMQPFPIVHIADVKSKSLEYQIEQILPANTVGFMSGQPGSYKTWLALEMALSIASGTPAFGQFKAKKGKVIAFNAEDSPEVITKSRIVALAKSKNICMEDIDLHLLDIPSLNFSEIEMQSNFECTIQRELPCLVILDPLRNLHSLNEDSATDMTPLLWFFRSLQKKYGCSFLFVCHDRKPGREEYRRESRTRGSNVLEGWRDIAIYLDKQKNNSVRVQIYHRSGKAPAPFCFKLETKDKEGLLETASLKYLSEGEVVQVVLEDTANIIKSIFLNQPDAELSRDDICSKVSVQRQRCLAAIKWLLSVGNLVENKIGKTTLLSWNSQELVTRNGAGVALTVEETAKEQ